MGTPSCVRFGVALLVAGCTNEYAAFVVGDTGAAAAGGPSGQAASGTGTSGSAGGGAVGSGGAGGSGVSVGGSGGEPGTGGGGSGVAGSGPGTIQYAPTIAVCLQPGVPDGGALCESQTGIGSMIIDTYFTEGGGGERHAYLRFDLDGQLAGKIVTAATLYVTVTDIGGSDSCGELWEVSAFDSGLLQVAVPTYQGASPLAGNPGAAVANATIAFPLASTQAIMANAPVYLGLKPVSGDGTRYWNAAGVAPPVLSIDHL